LALWFLSTELRVTTILAPELIENIKRKEKRKKKKKENKGGVEHGAKQD